MFERVPEAGVLDVLAKEGVGCIAFTPLAQGLLTNRYLEGIPADSRASKPHGFLKRKDIDERRLNQVRALSEVAKKRGQSLAQMALAWVLRHPQMTSALIGASRVEQIEQNCCEPHIELTSRFRSELLNLLDPDPNHVSTSFVERQNLTMRMSMRRFTRLTNGFSKKIDNHAHMVAIHFMHYNFARVHKTLRVTPAMEAGLSEHVWSLEEIVLMLN